jgi:signal peptidase I
MLRFMKVKGESLYPDYRNGDFVLVAKSPLPFNKVKPGDIIVFNQPQYGMMIKRVSKVSSHGLDVRGSLVESIDSRFFGLVPLKDVLGKVIWHIRQR